MINIIVKDATEEITNYEEAIIFAGQQMLNQGSIVSGYIKACVDRELNFPTGLVLTNGQGVAMPHGNSDLVNKDSISLVRTHNKIVFGRMEDKTKKVECNLIFNLALTSGKQHILVLKKLVQLFQDAAFISYCQNKPANNVQERLQQELAN